jgi:hypothetical protein
MTDMAAAMKSKPRKDMYFNLSTYLLHLSIILEETSHRGLTPGSVLIWCLSFPLLQSSQVKKVPEKCKDD